MADLSKIKLNGTTYNFKDATARASLIELEQSLETIHNPEEDNDVQAMLTSFGLTIPAETNNIVGTAIVGKALIQ